MSLQYVSDNNGTTTAVIIPIEEWNAIVQNHADLKKIGKAEDKKTDKVKPSDFKGIFSKEEGKKFHKYLAKVRKEWDRDFY